MNSKVIQIAIYIILMAFALSLPWIYRDQFRGKAHAKQFYHQESSGEMIAGDESPAREGRLPCSKGTSEQT